MPPAAEGTEETIELQPLPEPASGDSQKTSNSQKASPRGLDGGRKASNSSERPRSITIGTVKQQEIITAFGCRGFLSLAVMILLVFVGGSTWLWVTGIETKSFVLCLLKFEQQELAAQLGRFVAHGASQARAALHLALASESLLPAAAAAAHNATLPGAALQELAFGHGGDRYQAQLLTMLAALAPSFPTLSIHLASSAGAYLGITTDATTGATLTRSLSGAGGCLREERADGGAPPADDCAWSVAAQPWWAGGDGGCDAPPCWGDAYAVSGGAAVALRQPLAGGGLLAVELPLAEAEAYLRRLAMRSGTDEDPHKRVVYLVDGGGRLLAWAGHPPPPTARTRRRRRPPTFCTLRRSARAARCPTWR